MFRSGLALHVAQEIDARRIAEVKVKDDGIRMLLTEQGDTGGSARRLRNFEGLIVARLEQAAIERHVGRVVIDDQDVQWLGLVCHGGVS